MDSTKNFNNFFPGFFDKSDRPMPFAASISEYEDAYSLDENGCSNLFFAAQQGEFKKVQELIDKGAFINLANYQGQYPLFEAIKNKHEAVATVLIKQGANLLLKDKDGYNVAMLAVRHNMKKIVEILIKEYSYTLTVRCPQGKNLLDIAEEEKYSEISDLLTKKLPNLFIKKTIPVYSNKNIDDRKIFLDSFSVDLKVNMLEDNISKPRVVSDVSKNLERQDFLQQTLRLIIEKEQPSLIKGILDLGANPNCIYQDDFTPLSLCAPHTNLDCFEMLCSNGAKVSENINMHAAVYFQNISMMKRLMEMAPDTFNILDTKEKRPRQTFNPFLMAIFYESTKVLNHIFQNYSPEIVKNLRVMFFPLHYAILYRKYQSVETLLQFIHSNEKNKNGDTALMLMARIPNHTSNFNLENELIAIANLLIPRGADINAFSKDGETAYQIALNNDKPMLAKRLDTDNRSNIQFKIVKRNPKQKTETILDLTTLKPSDEPQSNTIKSIAGQEFLDQLLRVVVEQEKMLLINDILDLGANPHCVYEDKFTPLSLCARHQNLDCFEALYVKGAPLDKKNPYLLLALHAAIRLGNILLLERIMKQDFKIINKLSSHFTESTPLHYAIFYGRDDAVKALLRFMHPDQRDKHGDTPLIFLAKHPELLDNMEAQKHLASIARILLDKGADFYAPSAEGQYALEIARDKKKTILADELVEISTGVKPKPLQFSVALKPVSKPNNIESTHHYSTRKRNLLLQKPILK